MLGYTVFQATVSRYFLHQTDGQPSRGGPACAIKSPRFASIPRRSHGDTRPACSVLSGQALAVKTAQIAGWVPGSGAALDANRPLRTLEESVCAPPSASEPLCIECLGSPRHLVVSSKRLGVDVAADEVRHH
jgi:hypothetical protein